MSAPWQLLICLSDVPSARILTDVLASEGIATRLVTDAAVMGQAAPCRIFVQSAQMHRARRVISEEPLTEPELIFLATGESAGEGDEDPLDIPARP
jgi:hypothetical protein